LLLIAAPPMIPAKQTVQQQTKTKQTKIANK